MMNVGIDLVKIENINKLKKLEKVFTKNELEYISKHNSLETIAGLYASKEAMLKSLKLGISSYELLDIEVRHDENNAPYLTFYGNLKKKIVNEQLSFSLSISHDGKYAIAIVINYKNNI